MEFPVLRIELEGLKQNIATMFNQNNDELNKMVIETIENKLTAEWVQAEINSAVEYCIRNAIKEVSGNWKLQAAITELISENIEKLITKDS